MIDLGRCHQMEGTHGASGACETRVVSPRSFVSSVGNIQERRVRKFVTIAYQLVIFTFKASRVPRFKTQVLETFVSQARE